MHANQVEMHANQVEMHANQEKCDVLLPPKRLSRAISSKRGFTTWLASRKTFIKSEACRREETTENAENTRTN